MPIRVPVVVRDAGAGASAPRVPLKTDGIGAIAIATINIRDGRNGGLESAVRAFNQLGVGIGFVQETKFRDRKFAAPTFSGYSILTTDAESLNYGSGALLYKESDHYELEEAKIRGNNVISFELEMGRDVYFMVGCYIPPSDVDL